MTGPPLPVLAADPQGCCAAWSAAGHGQPDVVETGVAWGVTVAVEPRAGPGVR